MSKYYKRRNRKQNNGAGELVGVLTLGLFAYAYTSSKNLADGTSYALSILGAIVIALLSIIALTWWHRRQKQRAIYETYNLANIDTMEGIEFERYLADLLRRIGYTDIKLTGYYDLGVDFIAKKDDVTWGIQAKRYSSTVKAAAVRQVYTALTRYKCDRAMVISNSTYTRQAKTLAEDTNTVLIDREALQLWVYEASKKQNQDE